MKFFKTDDDRVEMYDQRFYPIEIDGEKRHFENVTNILGIVAKGYYYEAWLKEQGQEADFIRDKKGVEGTYLHRLSQEWLYGNKVSYFDLPFTEGFNFHIWAKFFRWLKFWNDFKDRIEYNDSGIEKIVYSKIMEYAGTADLVCKLDDEPVIFDWKFGNDIHKQSDQQIVAYMMALNEMTAKNMFKTGYIVHIPDANKTKKGYSLHKVELTEKVVEVWKATLMIKRHYEPSKPRFIEYPTEIQITDNLEQLEQTIKNV